MKPDTTIAENPVRTRVLGSLLILIGAGLAVFMGVATWQNAPTFLHPGELIGGELFTGTREQGQFAVGLFSAVTMAGLVFVGVGVHQVLTGRREKRPLLVGAAAIALTKLVAWQMARML